MNIWLVSDTHFEMFNPMIKTPDEEIHVIVAAGDIDKKRNVYDRLLKEFVHPVFVKQGFAPHLVFVPGNHEFYGQDIVSAHQYLMDEFDSHMTHYLHPSNSSVTIDGVTFIGSTLWGAGAVEDPLVEMNLKNGVADFTYINYQGEILTPSRMHSLNRKHADSIGFALAETDWHEDKVVVVSHHLPSEQCISERFKTSKLNAAFASDQEDFMYLYQPDYWLFGHTHDEAEVEIHETTCISAPCGYNRQTEYEGRVINL